MGTSLAPIEIGSLTAVSPDESRFIGSSSGIFFVNTVRRAFALSKAGSPQEDSPLAGAASTETYIGGVDSDDNQTDNQGSNQVERQTSTSVPSAHSIQVNSIGRPPDRQHASQLIQSYFRAWHPIFPFIHGPSFLKDLEDYYSELGNGYLTEDRTQRRRRSCRAITFQCIFNIAALDNPDLQLPSECSIKSASLLQTQLFSLTNRHDIAVLQALLAGQLYLIAIMSLHAASTIGGTLMRLILHGGFHRCPCRYPQLFSHDTTIRKRIFWSAYAMDRYLSQALGLPLGIQDSDIDVCLPGGEELHHPAPKVPTSTEVALHLPEGHQNSLPSRRTRSVVSSEPSPPPVSASTTIHSKDKKSSRDNRPGEEALAHYVSYGRLTGRALEMLHKSLNFRKVQYSDVLELMSEIHSFWNSLPHQLQDLPSSNEIDHGRNTTSQNILGLFFTIIHQQLILLVNRPFLSLEPSSLEFRLSLQTCIGASRTVISTLKNHTPGRRPISWPGSLSVTWMSGLIIAFACALDLYPVKKGSMEIKTCLALLENMSYSPTARHCHSALQVLLDGLSSPQAGEGFGHFSAAMSRLHNNALGGNAETSRESPSETTADEHSSKRRRIGDLREGDRPTTVNGTTDNGKSPIASGMLENADGPSFANHPGVTIQDSHYSPDHGLTNPATFWVQQSMMNSGNMDPLGSYSQDIFGSLSWENFLHYGSNIDNEWLNYGFLPP